MTMNLKDNFDLDKVEFTDMELEIPYYEKSHQTKEMSQQKTYHNRNN